MTSAGNLIKTLLIAGFLYGFAWSAALVTGLATWTQYHVLIRSVGSDTLAFAGVLVLTGTLAFVAAAWGLRSLAFRHHLSCRHGVRAWALYLIALGMTALNIVYWPSAGDGFEGANITAVAGLSLTVLGIGADLAIFRGSTRKPANSGSAA